MSSRKLMNIYVQRYDQGATLSHAKSHNLCDRASTPNTNVKSVVSEYPTLLIYLENQAPEMGATIDGIEMDCRLPHIDGHLECDIPPKVLPGTYTLAVYGIIDGDAQTLSESRVTVGINCSPGEPGTRFSLPSKYADHSGNSTSIT